MIFYCTECEADREFDEAFEDRFDPGSYYGHYQVSAGLVCLDCGHELEEQDD